jgi:ABC-2 type transport system permease protein
MLNITRWLFVRHRWFLIASGVLFAGFQFLTCGIISSMDLPSMFDQFLAVAPPIVRAMIEQSMLGASTPGVLAFTWNHPVTHALMTAVAITLGARAIAGEIENGAIELVLAQPVSRRRYLTAHVIFALVSLTIVIIAGLLGAVIGGHVFGLEPFGWYKLLQLLLNLLLLQMSFYSLTLFFSSLGRETGRVATLAVLVAIVSLLINFIATLWNRASFMKPYSLHSYYDPRDVLVHANLAPSSIIVLTAFAAIALAAAFARFLTRDLP